MFNFNNESIKQLTTVLLILSSILFTTFIVSSTPEPIIEYVEVPITPPTPTLQSIVSDTLNETYTINNDDIAITLWNKLNAQGIPATLVYGNISMTEEPITKCDRLWVMAEGVAIDNGQVSTSPIYQEGYEVNPTTYKAIVDGVDDYLATKSRYFNAVDSYNSDYNGITKWELEESQKEYNASSEKILEFI